ncbi:MAG: rod shape-determining protein RodA [Blautia sp.]|nr:rod shape-determining protein RodA [Blautia sp.]
MIRQYKLRFYNFRLIFIVLLTSVIGIQLVGMARSDLKSKQLGGVILGLIIMLILSLMDYSWIMNFQWIMYGFNIVMLLGVRIFGDSANGAARWIDLGFIRFQPTELSKIIIILFFAKYFMDHEETLNTFRTIAEAVILLVIPLALVYMQPDMKNTITITILFCVLIYIAGLSYKIIGGIILVAIPLLIIFLTIVVQPDQKLIKDYQRDRIMSFLYPENDEYSDEVEQQNNSKMAIASGELFGKKIINNEDVSSVNDGNFVSENQTDFIFAVAGEEFGFLGCTFIILMFFFIPFECVRMSLRAKDLAGKIICCGMATLVALQSFINICVATGLAPNTGTPLPFISYGLSSLVSMYIGIGLVLNAGLQSSAYNKELKNRKTKFIDNDILNREEYL